MKRTYHTWDKWECYPAGFYESRPPRGLSSADAVRMYAEFLRDLPRFGAALNRVRAEWPRSCEHYLSNETMNRIAWLGQAAMCIDSGIPSCFRGGYNLLSDEEKAAADALALDALNRWLEERGEPPVDAELARSKLDVDLY